MSRLVNHAEAVAFLSSIRDPVVQALIQHAHGLIFTDASDYFTTDFDLLLFYKVLEALFRDREKLAKFPTTEIPETFPVQQDSEESRQTNQGKSIVAKPFI
jgi:hypothetical protein